MSLWGVAFGAAYDEKDIMKFMNDKEVKISSFSKNVQQKILESYKDVALKEFIILLFQEALLDFLNNDDFRCELKLIDHFKEKLLKNQFAADEKNIEEYLKLLRSLHEIDDIFYELLSGINKDFFGLKRLDTKKSVGHLYFKHEDLLKQNDVNALFEGFDKWPDESNQCAYEEFMGLKRRIRNIKGEPSKNLNDIKILSIKAYDDELISLDTYHRIQYLREKSFITKRDLWLSNYFDIIFKAKNVMIPLSYVYKTKNIEDEPNFSSERVRRLSSLTRRKLLYRKYDQTQIIQLAQVLQKASRRMGSDPDTISKPPILTQEFDVLMEDGHRQTYVEQIEIDPQSQYNLARRLLRKDILDLQVMDEFKKLKVTFEDVIMASLETGYISLEDITLVVRYDDLWNPNEPVWQKIIQFTFQIAGYASFYIPPPWNVVASIALGVTEGLIDSQFKTGAEHDNPATFIE